MSLALALLVASCSTTRISFEERTALVRVKAAPAGTAIWKIDGDKRERLGIDAVALRASYQTRRYQYNHANWIWPILSIGATVAGGALLAMGYGDCPTGNSSCENSERSGSTRMLAGALLTVTGGLGSIFGLWGTIDGERKHPREETVPATIQLAATRDGHREATRAVSVPGGPGEVHLALAPEWYFAYGIASGAQLRSPQAVSGLLRALGDPEVDTRRRATAALGDVLALLAAQGDDPSLGRQALREVVASDADVPTREAARHALHRIELAVLAAPKKAKRGAIVAVFEIEDAAGKLDANTLGQLTDYLSAQLTEAAGFQTVPRDQLRKRLVEGRKNSYAPCVDQSCQIALGQAVAANKTLATKILQIGERCAVSASLYDLRTETSDKAATVDTECSQSALLAAIKALALKLVPEPK
jgi:hypothetical protein